MNPTPGPTYVRIANLLLPFVIVGAVLRIGVSDVFGWAKEVAGPLAWLAAPVGSDLRARQLDLRAAPRGRAGSGREGSATAARAVCACCPSW